MFTSRIEARMAAHLHGVDAAARQQRGAPAPAEVLPSFEEEGEDEDDTPAWLVDASQVLSKTVVAAPAGAPAGSTGAPGDGEGGEGVEWGCEEGVQGLGWV